MNRHALRSIVPAVCCWALFATPIAAQTPDTPEAQLARIHVAQTPIGSTVKVWTRDGERFKAILFAVDASAVRLKPVTRVPEPSRLVPFDRIERIERYQDSVNVGKYAGVGAGIGATVLLLLLVSL